MSTTQPSEPSQPVVSQTEVKVEGQAGTTQPSNQVQTLPSQGEVKDASKGDYAQLTQRVQDILPLKNDEVEVTLEKTSPSKPKKPRPPFDLFPLVYWILFFLAVVFVPIWMAQKPVTQVNLPFLKHDVAAYTLITANDVNVKSVNQNTVANDTIQNANDLVGHYTLVAIRSDQEVHQNQIGPKPDQGLIMGTFAEVIPTNSEAILGGNLRAGDVVRMAAISHSNPTELPILVFDKVLVLDVKSVGGQTIVVLAIPKSDWLDYLTKTRNATVVLARY